MTYSPSEGTGGRFHPGPSTIRPTVGYTKNMASPPRWTSGQRRRRMALRHGLLAHNDSDSPSTAQVASTMVGLHSSDPVTVYLSIAARSRTATVDSVQQELDQLIRHHAMRRTLWVFDQATATTAHVACTAKIARAERNKLIKALTLTAAPNAPQEPEQWLAQVADVVHRELLNGPLSTRQLGERLPEFRVMLEMAPGKPYSANQSALSRVLLLMGFDGRITRRGTVGGGWINSQYLWQLADGIVVDSLPKAEAQRDLTQQWLHAFGPATATDLRWWTGWTVTDTRQALAAAGASEVLLDDGEPGWCLPDDIEPDPAERTWTAALPGLDPTIMGWKRRDWYLDPDMTPTLFDRNGNGGPSLWVDGQVVGGWVQTVEGSLDYRLLADVGRDHITSLEGQLARLATFIGETRFKVRFPAPLQKELYGKP